MGRGSRMDFCCCALPLVNFGAYAIIIEVAFVSLCVGILALAPPSIVATMGALPGWTKGLMAAFGFITFVWQLLGLISVARESPSLYRFYIRINFLLTLIIIVLAIAFFATSAAKHSDSLNACINNYGAAPNTSGTGIQIAQASDALSGTGHDICNIFIWVQVGVMGLLLVVLGFTQLYMCLAQRAYGKHQREAEKRYTSLGAADEIPLAARDSGVWEPRHEPEYAAQGRYDSRGAPRGGAYDQPAYPAYPSGGGRRERSNSRESRRDRFYEARN